MAVSWDLLKRTKKKQRKKSSRTKSSSTTPIFFGYKDITLKLFLEIIDSQDFSQLLKKGTATPEECQDQWERIVEKHNYHNGNYEHLNYLSHLQSYKEALQRFNTIKSSLMLLLVVIDNPTIEFLNYNGYKIDTSSQEKYELSLKNAFLKSDNLNSKLKMSYNQLNNFNDNLISKREEFERTKTTLEEKLAALSWELGFSVDDTVTLARYNEYVRIINKNNGPRTQGHNNG